MALTLLGFVWAGLTSSMPLYALDPLTFCPIAAIG